MPKSTSASNAILNLIYRAVAWANIADNADTAPLTNMYISLHTASPGVGGDQQTNEANFGGYQRVAVVRTTSGWSAPSLGQIANSGLLQFDECTSGSNNITHVALGTAASGAGSILHFGALSEARTVSSGIRAQFAAAQLTVTES